MQDIAELQPGQRISHTELGQGVVVETPRDGYVRAFFPGGERRVPLSALRLQLSRAERILSAVGGSPERLRRSWLAYQAHAIPLMESAAALTSARIDLLPHQVVLTHRVATASPRRFLIADEVGLGKTIETALILRELASRGEMERALMVVPAGLVNNWHRELNEVFNLDFEVFGSEGDVTDRKSNAFAKHHRLIASIDTLKRPTRIKRILEAPRWDLVVFDEAHHLTATRDGTRIRKTENYKLAEALKGHTRDLLLLSATPHQGNHFQFWMLIQLLNPTLFRSVDEMVEHRHRLSTVVYRRTKADACQPDGSPLFARRWVHTESFVMSPGERRFYECLQQYLQDGFDLAKRKGGQGRALGFLMAIFQKIAASSFAAVRRTLQRRLLMLTIHEAVIRDRELDIDGREKLYAEARELIHVEYALPHDTIGRSEADRVLADLKLRLVKRLDEEELEFVSDPYGSEYASLHAEELAGTVVSLHLPEERTRIREVLGTFPEARETKVDKLLSGLGVLWRQNPQEKVVIFATYLGTVDLISREIEAVYPGQGVVVLRGGDHGSKLAAERRFRQKDGPRVLVCTAAGREGINLQFARILFNFDLPWNPMDIEQRIGRIHRYGQRDTAQVYNLVLSDTIEGRIFLLLNDKLTEIARTLGKVDEHGNVAEDLRSQVLGQLSERLNYDHLYQAAISDPELRRTKVELEAALSNASEARQVVFELFQDLEGFSLDEYKPFADVTGSLGRLREFLNAALAERGQRLVDAGDHLFDLKDAHGVVIVRFTDSRDKAINSDGLNLLGLDHPIVEDALGRARAISPEELGNAVKSEDAGQTFVTWWLIEATTQKGERRSFVLPLALRRDGTRVPQIERNSELLFSLPPTNPSLTADERLGVLHQTIEPTVQRELRHRGVIADEGSFSAELLAWIEMS
jgi:superfamily II DNA or RNA helicase